MLVVIEGRCVGGVVDCLDGFGNFFLISRECVLEEFVGSTDECNQIFMICPPENPFKLGSDFFIWDSDEAGHLPRIIVGVGDFFVGEIAEMDEEGQYIVLAVESFYVILEGVGVDFNAFTSDETDDIVLKAVLIHVDVGHQRFCGGGLLPV